MSPSPGTRENDENDVASFNGPMINGMVDFMIGFTMFYHGF